MSGPCWGDDKYALLQAQVDSKSSRQEIADLKAENHALSLTICEKEENLSLLRDQFREEVITPIA